MAATVATIIALSMAWAIPNISSDRLKAVIAKVRALGASRALVSPDQLVGTSYGWSLPYTSLILSSRNGPTSSIMFVNGGLRLEDQFLDESGQFLFTSNTTRRSIPWFALPAGPRRKLK